MSIIHDALKKVQQKLASKTNEIEIIPSTKPPQTGYLYANDTKAETAPQDGQQNTDQQNTNQQDTEPKSPVKNKIKSIFALSIAIAITVASLAYIYKQFQNSIPKVQKLAKSSFYKLINKKEVPEFKTKPPEELKPLAKITISTPASPASNTLKPPAPTTLNIHGIMSNGTGNLVLINDQVYQEGDEVDGAKIVKISLKSITVINNGVEQSIPVKN